MDGQEDTLLVADSQFLKFYDTVTVFEAVFPARPIEVSLDLLKTRAHMAVCASL